MPLRKLAYFLIILVSLFLSFSNSLALSEESLAEISLQKANYSSRETMLAVITLNKQPVNPISPSDLSLSSSRIAPMLLKSTSKTYYAFFDIPEMANSPYSLDLKLLYNLNGVLSTSHFSKEFYIDNSLDSISVMPAAIKADASKSYDYQVYVKNNGINPIDIEVSESISYISLSKLQISLDSNYQKSFFISIDKNKIASNNTEFVSLKYAGNEFHIPIVIYNFNEKTMQQEQQQTINVTEENTSIIDIKTIAQNESSQSNVSNSTITLLENETSSSNMQNPLSFISLNDLIKFDLPQNKSKKGILLLGNSLGKPLYGINISLTGNLHNIVLLNQTYIARINANSNASQYIFINYDKDAKLGTYTGSLSATSSEGYSALMPVEISVVMPVEINQNILQKTKNAVKNIVSGDGNSKSLVADDEIIEFSSQKAMEKKEPKKKEPTWPLLLFLIVIAFLVFIFYKLMSRKKPVSFEEYVSSVNRKK